jgi:hypothetical protein
LMVCSKSSQSPGWVVRFELPNCAMPLTTENRRISNCAIGPPSLHHEQFFEKNLNCVATAHTQNQEKTKLIFITFINKSSYKLGFFYKKNNPLRNSSRSTLGTTRITAYSYSASLAFCFVYENFRMI